MGYFSFSILRLSGYFSLKKSYNRLMGTEIVESEKKIRDVPGMTKALGYQLFEGQNTKSHTRLFVKDVGDGLTGQSVLYIDDTGIGSKHIKVGAMWGGTYNLMALEKTMDGLELPKKEPEGYRNLTLQDDGYNKIVRAVMKIEESGFFKEQVQRIRSSIHNELESKKDGFSFVFQELIPAIKEVLPKFDGTEDRYLEGGTIYLFPSKQKNTESPVPVIRIEMNVRENTVQITRSSSVIFDGENGREVNKTKFEKKRLVKKGRYEFPYYVWEGKKEEINTGIEKLVKFLQETGA